MTGCDPCAGLADRLVPPPLGATATERQLLLTLSLPRAMSAAGESFAPGSMQLAAGVLRWTHLSVRPGPSGPEATVSLRLDTPGTPRGGALRFPVSLEVEEGPRGVTLRFAPGGPSTLDLELPEELEATRGALDALRARWLAASPVARLPSFYRPGELLTLRPGPLQVGALSAKLPLGTALPGAPVTEHQRSLNPSASDDATLAISASWLASLASGGWRQVAVAESTGAPESAWSFSAFSLSAEGEDLALDVLAHRSDRCGFATLRSSASLRASQGRLVPRPPKGAQLGRGRGAGPSPAEVEGLAVGSWEALIAPISPPPLRGLDDAPLAVSLVRRHEDTLLLDGLLSPPPPKPPKPPAR